jgi:hypothetical protein
MALVGVILRRLRGLSISLQSLRRLVVDRRARRMTDRSGDTIGEGELPTMLVYDVKPPLEEYARIRRWRSWEAMNRARTASTKEGL